MNGWMYDWTYLHSTPKVVPCIRGNDSESSSAQQIGSQQASAALNYKRVGIYLKSDYMAEVRPRNDKITHLRHPIPLPVCLNLVLS